MKKSTLAKGETVLVRWPPLNLKFFVARIKLTFQQATTCTPLRTKHQRWHPRRRFAYTFRRPSTPRRCIAIPHAHILHLITFLKYDPPDTNVSPLSAAATPILRLRHGGAPTAILYAKFHGPWERNGNPSTEWTSLWKITRGIFRLEYLNSFLFDFYEKVRFIDDMNDSHIREVFFSAFRSGTMRSYSED